MIRHEQNGFVKFLTIILLLFKVCAADNISGPRLILASSVRFRHFLRLVIHCVNVDYNLAELVVLISVGLQVANINPTQSANV